MTAAIVSGLTLVTSMVMAPVGGTPHKSSDRFALYAVEQRLIERTNAVRARYGLPQLVVDTGLIRSARRHTIWMVHNRRLQHTSAFVAENIAMGQSSSAQVVQDWMNSPGHRANILNPSHRRIGVAAFRGPDGTIFWCQQFLQ